MNSAPYIQDGNTTTSWVADTPGKDQWVYLEIEHGGINLYKAQLLFDKKMYPYTIQYKTNNASDDEWITLREYTADTIASRPEEESFDGTYMRYIRILFKDVPEGEYANLAELKLFGIRADTTGYSIGYESLADIPVDGSASTTVLSTQTIQEIYLAALIMSLYIILKNMPKIPGEDMEDSKPAYLLTKTHQYPHRSHLLSIVMMS